jgi:hypothetical protein
MDLYIHVFLTLAIVGEWSVSRQRERPKYTLDRLGGPQSWSEQYGEVKISNSDPLIVQPAASRYTHCTTSSQKMNKLIATLTHNAYNEWLQLHLGNCKD